MCVCVCVCVCVYIYIYAPLSIAKHVNKRKLIHMRYKS